MKITKSGLLSQIDKFINKVESGIWGYDDAFRVAHLYGDNDMVLSSGILGDPLEEIFNQINYSRVAWKEGVITKEKFLETVRMVRSQIAELSD